MKTKISHLGRSTVSVILAVMMLLSTMLVGTVSTANAADLSNATKVYLDSTLATLNNEGLNTWGSIYAYAFNDNGVNTYTDKNTDGKSKWPGSVMYDEGNGIYSIYVDNSATKIIFNNNDSKQTGNLTLPPNWKTTAMIYRGDGTEAQGSAGWTTYSTTKTLTTPVIAWANGDDGYIPPKGKQTLSVTNTSAYESISGVTYELYKGSSSSGTKTATGVTNTTGVFDVTESAYYTVKVSTTDSDYTSPSDESNTLQSYCITPSYYLTGDISGGWQDEHQNDNIVSDYYTGISSNKRIFSKTVEIDKEKYFRLIDGSNQQYKPDGSSNNNDFDVSNSTSYATKKSTTTNDGTNGAFKIPKAGKYIIYVDQSTPSPSVWVEEVTAPKHSVTFKSNNESMGSVTAVFEGTATSIGTSPASVEDGKSVTFKATANDGYKFVGWYSDADCTKAIENATDTTYTTTVTADTTVYAKFNVVAVEVTFGLQGSNIVLVDNTKLSWTYSDSASFTAENNYTLKFYAQSDNIGDNKFRFIDSALTNYGSGSDTIIDLAKTDAYKTVKDNKNVYFIKKSDKPYTIRLTNPGETPPTFKVTQGTQYSVTVDNNIEYGTIFVDNSNPYVGDTVTVTATPDPDYVLDTVKFNGESAKVVGNKATFIMPDKDVTVTATFRQAKKYTVTIASDITNGSVKANDSSKEITVTEGTPVKLVATPNDSYSFSSWSIKPEDGYTAEGSMTSATETIYPTDNITVSASFTQGTESTDHFLAWGENQKEKIGDWTDGAKTYSSKDENGYDVYTAYLKPSLFKENTWYRFAVTNKIPTLQDRLIKENLWYNFQDITVNGSKTDNPDDNAITQQANYDGNFYGMFQYSGELVSLSISYNVVTKNYQVTPVIKVHNGAKLYAKNGSCRTDNQYPNDMHNKGTTTISYDTTKYDVDIDKKSSTSYQLAYLSEENIKDEVKLTITTQVTDPDYSLAGWCVDGETYLPKKTTNAKSNEYSFDYYVKSTTKLTDTIEVTPVYFYRTSTDTETVRFYVTGFDDTVKKDWGNTIAVYPYYSGGTGGDVFSNYPGQPMLVSGGRCYVDLPITYKGGRIAGVTLNNYFYDDVHNKLVSDNRQTYDYNDFLKIYEQKIKGSTERKSQEIIFSFKYVPSESGYNNFGDASTGKGTTTYPETISAEAMEATYTNGWEDLTDFYGNKVDLYNKKVDASSEAGKKNPWRVISNGYEQTYFGYYATRWAVYKPVEDTGEVTNYLLVDVISSSSLLYNSYEAISTDTTHYSAGDTTLSASSDAEAYQAFTDAGAVGVPVKITYEQTIERDNSIEGQPKKNENAFRNDGRWYYSQDNLDVTAHTVIEYADTLDGFSGKLGENFHRDYYQEGKVDYTKAGYDSSKYTGQITKTSAYFTNEGYYQKTEANGQTGTDNTFDIIANTDHTSEYIFVGWYLLSEGKYSPLTSTVENSVSVPQDNNDVYVARFIKAPSGSLTISHTLHPNATGLGKCYVSVDVLDSTDKVIHHYDETTSDITVSNEYIKYGKDYKIKITLKTVPGEASSFIDFYSYSKDLADFVKLVDTETGAVPAVTVTKIPADGTYKAEISFDVDDYLFNKDSTGYQQKIKVLNYYSQLSLGSVKYEIKYTFDTRLYGTKVYKVSGTLTADDISKYGCTKNQLSNSFVMAKAPFESNFKQNITWDSNQIEFGSEGGTLTAAITATQVEDKEVTATFYVDSVSPFETITTTFGNRFFKNGSYISANSTGTTYNVDGLPDAYKNTEGNFSFWYVMTKDKEFVTKAYGQNFAYTGYDNYIVVAVYGVEGTHKDTPTDSSINFLQYSRNHWNDTVTGENGTGSYSLANKEYDRLYADFNLMFNHNGYLLNKYSGTPNIKVGYAMVIGSKKDDNYTVDETELQKAISENATNGGSVEHQSTSLTAKQAVTVTESDGVVAKKNVIVNSIRIADLDNKNRITSYYGFKNSEANQSYYVKVYSYVIVDNEVTLSKTPVVINLKDIGTKTCAAPQQ